MNIHELPSLVRSTLEISPFETGTLLAIFIVGGLIGGYVANFIEAGPNKPNNDGDLHFRAESLNPPRVDIKKLSLGMLAVGAMATTLLGSYQISPFGLGVLAGELVVVFSHTLYQ